MPETIEPKVIEPLASLKAASPEAPVDLEIAPYDREVLRLLARIEQNTRKA